MHNLFASGDGSVFARVPAVERPVGSLLILARPEMSEAKLLGPTAAVVWQALGSVHDVEGLGGLLSELYPEIAEDVRAQTLSAILGELEADGLVTRTR